jgi:LmbE family N-acetylglucosaminyl deacetylase
VIGQHDSALSDRLQRERSEEPRPEPEPRAAPSVLGPRLLVIAPHPDDETIGCGGLLSRMARTPGCATGVVAVVQPFIQSVEELTKACALLEVDAIWTMDVGRIPHYDHHTIDDLDRIIETFKPDTIAAPYVGAAHQEHRSSAQLVMSVCRPSAGSGRHRPRTVLTYEEPSDVWTLGPGFHPNLFVELTEADVDRKCAAMAAHRSQTRPFPSERSEEALRALAVMRGVQNGCGLAEAFQLQRHTV